MTTIPQEPPSTGAPAPRKRGRPSNAERAAEDTPADRAKAIQALIPATALLAQTASMLAVVGAKLVTRDATLAALAQFSEQERSALATQTAAVLAKYPSSSLRYMEEGLLGTSLLAIIGAKVVAIREAIAARGATTADTTTH